MRHKYIDYLLTSISFAIVFYYFSISYSKTVKNQVKILETSTHVETQKTVTKCTVKEMKDTIHKSYSYRLTMKAVDEFVFSNEDILKSPYGLLIEYVDSIVALEKGCYLNKMRNLLKQNLEQQSLNESQKKQKSYLAKHKQMNSYDELLVFK